MKKMRNNIYLTLFLLLPFCSKAGNNNDNVTTFANGISTTTFDPETREFFIGSQGDVDDTQKFGKFSPVAGKTRPLFEALDITADAELDGDAVTHMKFFRIGTGSTAGRFLALTHGDYPVTADFPVQVNIVRADTATTIDAAHSTPATFITAESINDNAGTAITGRILGIDVVNGATTSYILAAIKAATKTNANFGVTADVNDGIVSIPVTHIDNVPTIGVVADSPINVTATDFRITAATTIVPTTFNDMVFTPDIKRTTTDLGTLYVSVKTTINGAARSEATGIVAYTIDLNGVPAKLGSVFEGLAGLDELTNNNVVYGVLTGADAAANIIDVNKIATMTTSTGAVYFVGSGGARLAAGDVKNNEVFALPLLNLAGGSNTGEFAKATATLTNGVFANTDVIALETDLVEVNTAPALVGGGALPMEATGTVNQLQCVGDTVYAAITPADSTVGAGGLYYSQALFDNTGKITRWSDWAAVIPPNESGQSAIEGACFAAGIDTAQGRVWTVADFPEAGAVTARKNAQVSRWWTDDVDGDAWVIGQINKELAGGPCYCAFDLNNSVANFGNQNVSAGANDLRFSFFGSDGKVIVTSIVQTIAAATNYVNAQLEHANKETATNAAYSLTNGLPAGARVLSLNWTGRTDITAAHNYILAGTSEGLYAWSPDGTNGFRTDTLDATNATPFIAAGSWNRLATIGQTESVIQIVTDTATTGAADLTYILTRSDDHLTSRIYTLNGDSLTLAALDTDLELVGTHTMFAGASIIYNIQLVGNTTGAEQQLVTSTDAGMFISQLGTGLLETTATDSTTQDLNNLFSTDVSKHTALIRPLNTRTPSSFYAMRNTASSNASGNETDTIFQFGTSVQPDNAIGDRLPVPTAGYTATTLVAGEFDNFGKTGGCHFDHLQDSMWTNGSLRFIITNNGYDADGNVRNKIISAPYDLVRPNLSARIDITGADDFDGRDVFYWIKNIAGHTMVGTDRGVMSLE